MRVEGRQNTTAEEEEEEEEEQDGSNGRQRERRGAGERERERDRGHDRGRERGRKRRRGGKGRRNSRRPDFDARRNESKLIVFFGVNLQLYTICKTMDLKIQQIVAIKEYMLVLYEFLTLNAKLSIVVYQTTQAMT